MAVFLGCTSTGRVGLWFLWFYVQEHPKAQPAVVLVLKRLRRRGNGLKSHPTDWEKPGIEPATPGLQDIGLSPTPRRLLSLIHLFSWNRYRSRRFFWKPFKSISRSFSVGVHSQGLKLQYGISVNLRHCVTDNYRQSICRYSDRSRCNYD